MIFFFVNVLGETYLGIQIGHYREDSGGAGTVAKEYAVLDVILSGKGFDTMPTPPQWVVQDGDGGGRW